MRAPPVASAPTLRNSRRFMLKSPWSSLATHELGCGQEQRQRLLRARRARDRGAGRAAEVGAEELRGELGGVAATAEPAAHRVRPLDALQERRGSVPIGAPVGPPGGRARLPGALTEELEGRERPVG